MNDDENDEKVCGILTHFIRKLTDLFFIIIGEKALKSSLEQDILLRKNGKNDTYI